MGVPIFFGQFIRQRAAQHRKGMLKNIPPKNVYSLSIDMNNLIHNAVADVFEPVLSNSLPDDQRQAKLDEHRNALLAMTSLERETLVFTILINHINTIVDNLKPQVLVLAVDGVAPDSKINQQRQRRYRSYAVNGKDALFDRNSITPGTDIMFRIDALLVEWIAQVTALPSGPKRVLYSSHMAPGEGEHKIMEMFRKGDIPDGGPHVIWGLDADLIMLSLLLPYNNVYIYRRDVGKRDGKVTNMLLSINLFKLYLRDVMMGVHVVDRPSRVWETEAVFHDFVFIMCMAGNDFMPALSYFASTNMAQNVETMLEVYTEMMTELDENRKPLCYYIHNPNAIPTWVSGAELQPPVPQRSMSDSSVMGGEWCINMEMMREFFTRLDQRSRDMLEQLADTKFEKPIVAIQRSVISGVFQPQQFDDEWYTYIMRNHLSANHTSYSIVQRTHKRELSTANYITQMSLEYVKTIMWVFHYYHTGAPVDTVSNRDISARMPVANFPPVQLNIRHQYRYWYAPVLSDICKALDSIMYMKDTVGDYHNLLTSQGVLTTNPANTQYLSAAQQVLSVIPPDSIKPGQNIVPAFLTGFFDERSPLRRYFPREGEYEIDTTGTSGKDHEGVVLTPFVDSDEIYRYIDALPVWQQLYWPFYQHRTTSCVDTPDYKHPLATETSRLIIDAPDQYDIKPRNFEKEARNRMYAERARAHRGSSAHRGGSSSHRGGSPAHHGGSSSHRGGSSSSTHRGGSSSSTHRGGSPAHRGGSSAHRGGSSAHRGGSSAPRGAPSGRGSVYRG